MDKFFELLPYSIKAVASIFLIAAAGTILVRYKILSQNSLQVISRLVFILFLPALLFTKVASSVTIYRLQEYWIFPVSCVIILISGTLTGLLLVKIFKPKEFIKNGVAAAVGFGNSSYVPITLMLAVTTVFPVFNQHPGNADAAITFISVYLLGYSPLFWTVGYSMISGNKMSELSLRKVLTPPVTAMLLGLTVGLIPPLKNLFCSSDSLLFPLFNATEVISMATVPCALLVLGGNLANGPTAGIINKRTIFSVIVTKLIVFPAVAILYVLFLRKTGLMPASLLTALVLVIEAGSPPATNLIVMTSLIKPEMEKGLATLLFWCYLASIFTLTAVILTTVWIFGY
ncbi:AEC family transporter [Lentisphaerota bacterium ZTH]|nr:AEC family transporter [Lentisphaerota bacterium]WET06583.1 AEC family transporter [Lentisphaerota bacterium ZTH]